MIQYLNAFIWWLNFFKDILQILTLKGYFKITLKISNFKFCKIFTNFCLMIQYLNAVIWWLNFFKDILQILTFKGYFKFVFNCCVGSFSF